MITVRAYYMDVPSGNTINVYNKKLDVWEWFDDLRHAARLTDLWNLLTTIVEDQKIILAEPATPNKPDVLRGESCCCHCGGPKAF